MSQPTKEQWEEIAQKMNRLFSAVYLRCDGYLVRASLVRDDNRLRIMIYVDGWFKGAWIEIVDDPDQFSDVPKRFYRHSSRQRMSTKELKCWEKIYGKRECKRQGFYNRRYISSPSWSKPMPLIRHLKKHNETIEILTYDDYKTALAARREAETEA